MRESDPTLRRLERTAVAWCGAIAGLAVVARGGRVDLALGVLGGGLLVGLSYWATKAWVDRVTAALAGAGGDRNGGPVRRRGSRRRQAVKGAMLLVGRYALLVLLAYVMMTRLRLHPIGLLLGASSVVAAAATEAVRTFRS